MPTVCLLGSGHIWVHPRLVKEADALHAAGYDVLVSYRAVDPAGIARDEAILARKPWRWHRHDLTRATAPAAWLRSGLAQRAAQAIARRGKAPALVDALAYTRGYLDVSRWAARQRADLYVAHTQDMLPVAAFAARTTGSPYAYDCYDLLAYEAADGGLAPWRREMILRIEGRYVPGAAYVSASSRPMAEYHERRYGVRHSRVWHNSFPRSETAGLEPPERRPHGAKLTLCWISATIGPGRNLEDVLRALPRLGPDFELHLYGTLPDRFRPWFAELTAGGLNGARVEIHPLPPAAEVMRTVATHQVGLTLDGQDCLNRSTAVCNKTCIYLQAGLAVVATRTPGHESVFSTPEGERAGRMYDVGDVDALVRLLRELKEGARLRATQEASWWLGQERFNWDVEQREFLSAVDGALAPRPLVEAELAGSSQSAAAG